MINFCCNTFCSAYLFVFIVLGFAEVFSKHYYFAITRSFVLFYEFNKLFAFNLLQVTHDKNIVRPNFFIKQINYSCFRFASGEENVSVKFRYYGMKYANVQIAFINKQDTHNVFEHLRPAYCVRIKS